MYVCVPSALHLLKNCKLNQDDIEDAEMRGGAGKQGAQAAPQKDERDRQIFNQRFCLSPDFSLIAHKRQEM